MASNDIRIRAWVKDEASGKVDRIKDKFDHLGKSGGFKSLVQGVGMGAGIAAMNLLGNAAGAAVGFLKDSIGAASDQREAMALNEQVFKGAAQTIDDWSDGTAKAFGESKTNAINYASAFGNVMKGAGMSADELAAKSMELTRRAADIGSAFNQAGDEVAIALRAGLVGETEPLRRLGILMNAAEVENRALAMGLAGTKKEITEAHKVLARYNIIMEQSADSAGMFGRDTGSLADAQKALDASMEDLQATLASGFIPALAEAVSSANDLALNLQFVADQGGEAEESLLKMDWAQFSNPIGAAVGSLITLNDALTEVREEADRTESVMNYMSRNVKDDLYVVKGAFGDMGRSAKRAGDKVKDVAIEVEGSFADMVDALIEDTERLIDDVFDPIETRADIYQAQMEQNAAEERLRDADTAREKREATTDILASMRDQADGLVDLGEQGKLTARDIDKFETNVKQSYKVLGKEVPRDIRRIIDALRNLDKWDGHSIDVGVYTHVITGGGKKKPVGSGGGLAAGGPVDPNKVYMVGEKGPELFVSDTAGTIIPNHRLTGDIGSGGGDVIQLIVQGGLRMDEDGLMTTVERMRAIARGRKVA